MVTFTYYVAQACQTDCQESAIIPYPYHIHGRIPLQQSSGG